MQVGGYSDKNDAEQAARAGSRRTSSSSRSSGRAEPPLDLALALLSGALLALSFPKFGHPAFAWIALAPLLVSLAHRPQSSRRAFSLGLTTGVVYFSGTLYWLVETMTTFGGLNTAAGRVRRGVLIAYLSLYPALFAVIQARLVRTMGKRALLLSPAVWVATEMGRTYVLDGFPWELLGYSQASVLPIAQIASVVGVYGLSALVALVSAAAAYAAVERSAAALACGRRSWPSSCSEPRSGARCGLRGARCDHRAFAVRVAVLQGNIPQDQKWDPAHART